MTEHPDPDPSVLSTESLWCRTERHDYRWERDSIAEDMSEYVRIKTCRRCTAEHHKVVSLNTFEVLWSGIVRYPSGYLVRGRGRFRMADLYREQYRREGSEHRVLSATRR